MLELRHIKKSYDNVTILEDINLKIQDGEIVSILGPSGCVSIPGHFPSPVRR